VHGSGEAVVVNHEPDEDDAGHSDVDHSKRVNNHGFFLTYFLKKESTS
jgi:hypothetical protein